MEKTTRKSGIATTVVMIVLIILFLPVLIINLTLIIKGSVNQDVPPDIFGVAPLAVVSPSMTGDNPDSFDQGALIFVKVLDEDGIQQLKEGDVVCYRDGNSYITHRIISLSRTSDNTLVSVVTQGDANAGADGDIHVDKIFGICTGHVNGLGNFTMFLQTPAGIIVFIGVPVLLFIVYDVLRITLFNKRLKDSANSQKRDDELKDKDEEIRRLQALLAEKENKDNKDS